MHSLLACIRLSRCRILRPETETSGIHSLFCFTRDKPLKDLELMLNSKRVMTTDSCT